MRYKMLTVSILAATLSAFVIGAAAQRSQQNSQNQTTQDQSNPGTPNGYGWYGGCGPGMMGYGMMGPGMMMGPGGMMGWGNGYGMMGGYGPGMMGWGNRPQQGNLNLSTSDVKGYVERWVTMMGNPRLKAGPITEKDSNTITADIVTADKNALVQRFKIDRHTGFWQPQPVD